MAQACELLYPDSYSELIINMEEDYRRSKLKGAFNRLELSKTSTIEKRTKNKHSSRQQRHL